MSRNRSVIASGSSSQGRSRQYSTTSWKRPSTSSSPPASAIPAKTATLRARIAIETTGSRLMRVSSSPTGMKNKAPPSAPSGVRLSVYHDETCFGTARSPTGNPTAAELIPPSSTNVG